jgi:hypothetical protein
MVLAGLVLTLAGRGRTRVVGAVLAAATGLLVIVFNSGYAAPWETFTIFALMFTGTMLYRAESGQYPRRRALYVTVRRNAMKPWFQCVLTHWNPGFTASGTTLSCWTGIATGKRSNAVSPTLPTRFRLAFREIPGTIPPCAGTADRRVIGMPARVRVRASARLGEAASPAVASHGGTLGVTAMLPNATAPSVTKGKLTTTISHHPRWPT